MKKRERKKGRKKRKKKKKEEEKEEKEEVEKEEKEKDVDFGREGGLEEMRIEVWSNSRCIFISKEREVVCSDYTPELGSKLPFANLL